MEPITSMCGAAENVVKLVAAPDRRPDFCAESMSQRLRVGILLLALVAAGLLAASVGAMAAWPQGLVSIHELFGVLMIGATLATTFAVMIVFGALVGNNPRLDTVGRFSWYALFALAGPVAVPCYWAMHVRSAPRAADPEPA